MEEKRDQVLHKVLIIVGFAFILAILAALIIVIGYDLNTTVETTETEIIIDQSTLERLVRRQIARRLDQHY